MTTPTVRFRRLFLPIRFASGADPTTLKTRSRTDCEPTRGPVRVVATGFRPFGLAVWCSANRNALLEGYASVSGAWIKEKPRIVKLRGLPIHSSYARLS